MSRLAPLIQAANASDAQADWMQVWQVLAGTALVVALEDAAGDGPEGERVTPKLIPIDGIGHVLSFEEMALFATGLDTVAPYAEIDGAELAEMLAAAGTPLAVRHAGPTSPLLIDVETLQWIATTYRAEVSRADAQGVRVEAPEPLNPAAMDALGRTVDALGRDCPEAWLIMLAAPDGTSETVLVLGLSDDVRRMEAEIAETVTRAVQAVLDRPIAVSCPDRGAPLMDRARRVGIGIG